MVCLINAINATNDEPVLMVTDASLNAELPRRTWRMALLTYMSLLWPAADLRIELEPLADYYLLNSQNNKAAICYLYMLEGRAMVPKFYNNAAIAFLRMDDPKTCLNLAFRSSLLNVNDVQSYRLQGLAFKKMGSYALACVAFSKVLQIDPNDENGLLGYRTSGAMYRQTQTQSLSYM